MKWIWRASRTSVVLYYDHFGKTKDAILASCMTTIVEDFYGLSDERTAMVEEGGLVESLKISHDIF